MIILASHSTCGAFDNTCITFTPIYHATYTYSGHVLAEHPLESIGRMLFPVSADHGLANHLIVGITDGGTTSLDLQHQSLHSNSGPALSLVKLNNLY